MAQPLEAPMPALVLDNGCRIVLEARDATTGLAVTGVFVSTVAIYGVNVGNAGDDTQVYDIAYVQGAGTGYA